jgi:hypothetical protein
MTCNTRKWTLLIVIALLLGPIFLSRGVVSAVEPTTFVLPGGIATTGVGAWGGMAGTVYPVAFNVDASPLTMTVYNLDVSGVKFTKVNPCCGPASGDAGLGAYAQVGVAGDTRLIDWPENGAQMFVNSIMGWNPATDGKGAWNAQTTKFTHDSARGADDGLGYRSYLQQCWYNPIDSLDPRDPWTNDFNKWNFQYNAEKYMGGVSDPEYDTFDLRMTVNKVGDSPKTYRIEWWVRLHQASSWDEDNRASNWGCPWNGALNNAATDTGDSENPGPPCFDEIPAETARVNGAWYRVESPGTPGADYFDVANVDFSTVYPHVGVHNGGASGNVGHTISWGDVVVVGEPVLQAGMATGGGWFIPDDDTFVGDTPGGKATFGFAAKQDDRKGSSGHLGFQYHVDKLDLKSTSYDWVTLSSTQVIFEGEGVLNGTPGFRFRVHAFDGDKTGGADRFTIRIWTGTDDYEMPTYRAEGELGGGQIVVHKK